MSASPIIIDCDPGHDDALALLLALASPELEVVAVTAVAGNVPLVLTAANARRLCELAGRADVPVPAGCERALLRAPVSAEHVHGRTGLDGADLPDPTMPLQTGHGVDAIVRILRERPAGTLTLCPIGPLTHGAMALRKAPDIAARIQRIVLMGGAAGMGNMTASAEFNIYADPHAARIVFESGVPIVMHGLDVTLQARVTAARIEAIRAQNTPVSRAVVGLLEFYGRHERTCGGGAPLHDPCAIAYLLQPELFQGREAVVDVETTGEFTFGRTVVDWSGRSDRAPNATVMTGIDADGFFALLTERLARLTGP